MTEALGITREAQTDALQRLRHSLYDVITAQPADREIWRSQLSKVLTKMGRIFGKHVSETEAPDGSLDDILVLKPYLAPHVRRIRDEHIALRTRIDQLSSAVKVCGTNDDTIDDLRLEAGRLADAIRQHQAAGIDLVYEAYLRVDGVG